MIFELRKKLQLTQQDLADQTEINRALISRIEKETFVPSIPQLEKLGQVLSFEPESVFLAYSDDVIKSLAPLNIAVAGTGYVGLSVAVLLAQHNHVTAVDIIQEKVDLINQKNHLFKMITWKNI